MPAAPVRASPGVAELREGVWLSAARGATVHGQLDRTSLTLYGPGQATRRNRQIVIEADAFVVDRGELGEVDRGHGNDLVELEVRGATIRVHRAVFSAYNATALQITVMRGEIVLRCPGANADLTVMAGSAATCGPPPPASSMLESALPPGPSRSADGVPVARRGLPAGSPPGPWRSADDVPVARRGLPAGSPPGPWRSADDVPVARRGLPAGSPPTIAHSPAAGSPPPSQPVAASSAALDRGAVNGPGGSRQPAAIAVGTASGDPTVPPRAADLSRSLPVKVEPAPPRLRATDAIALPDRPRDAARAVPAAQAAALDPAARYAGAEREMATDPAAARAALRALVADAPAAPEAAAAWLDLARLAAAAGDDVDAHAALNQLAAHPGASSLAMPAAYLRCTLERAVPGYRTCLAGFRAAFPGSPRDADALSGLAIASAGAGDCRAALPLLAEYLQRFPTGSSAAAVRSWRARCDPTAPR
jgi:hypothetical protein